jgi:hypothetical protein
VTRFALVVTSVAPLRVEIVRYGDPVAVTLADGSPAAVRSVEVLTPRAPRTPVAPDERGALD